MNFHTLYSVTVTVCPANKLLKHQSPRYASKETERCRTFLDCTCLGSTIIFSFTF